MMPTQKPKKILVVEDDEVIRETMKELLELEGYLVDCAPNGAAGLESLRATDRLPSLILLDMTMPVKDGYEFRKEQVEEKNWASIPVLVMTADGDIEAKTTQVGANGYIKKPFDVDHVLNMVGRYCQ